jgi:hypothetical protein
MVNSEQWSRVCRVHLGSNNDHALDENAVCGWLASSNAATGCVLAGHQNDGHTHTQIPTPLPLHDHYFMGLLRATSPASRTYLHSLNIVFEQEVTGRGIERNINL